MGEGDAPGTESIPRSGAGAGLTAHPVRTGADLRTFVDLSARIARVRGEADHYVPLFASDIAAWRSGSGWFAEAVELWLVRDRSGDAVGRMMCHRSRLLAERIAQAPPTAVPPTAAPETLFFGALEAADPAALEAVIGLILDRADRLGAARVFGPVSPLPNVTGGLVTAGTEHPGFFDTAWNPDFFGPVFAAAGFSQWGPARTWEVRVDGVPHDRATAVTSAEWAQHGLRRRPVSRWRLRHFAARLLPTLNAAFSALPYYTPISPSQLRSQMAGLSALLDPALVIDVAGGDESDDAPPRCFALVIPDPVSVLRRHGGRLGPTAIGDLLRQRGRLRDAVLIIQGTDPRFQGQGLLSLVIREVFAALAAGGYRRLRVTFIAEDNPASAAVFARAGGRPLHTLCFLDRALGPPTGARVDSALGPPTGARVDSDPDAQLDSPRDEPSRGPDREASRGPDREPSRGPDREPSRGPDREAKAIGAGATSTAPGVDESLIAGLIEHAGRAPSAHNTQPWRPRLVGITDDPSAEVVVTVDDTRTLPIGDPRSEDLHLSIGCWVEAFAIAAAEAGLATEFTSIRGWGPSLEVQLRVASAEIRSDGPPAFSTADLLHRQVDRGPLARDEASVSSALDAINSALTDSGARLVEIPDSAWVPLHATASRWSMTTPAVFAETLGWLRFDVSDPAYRQDGLTAECLRIPTSAARLAGLLNRAALRPAIARAIALAAAPPAWFERRDRAGVRGPANPAAASARTGAPHHVVLAVTESASRSGTDDGASREVGLGRELLRAWLRLDRAGLRVDVHSEIKDCPETHAQLRRLLDGRDTTRPLATFSIGRSTTSVPRSHRR